MSITVGSVNWKRTWDDFCRAIPVTQYPESELPDDESRPRAGGPASARRRR